MKREIFSTLCVFLLAMPAIHAQQVVTDSISLAQGIVNSVNEMVETSEAARDAMSTFKETPRIYEQGRKYYDILKGVNSLTNGSLKIKEPVLMLPEISEGYVTDYGKILTDGNYTQWELEAIVFGYNNIVRKSSTSVTGLEDIIDPTGMSMTNKERLDPIERVYCEMRHYRTLVNYYTRKNLCVSYLRTGEKGETGQVLRLYGEDERYW